MRSTVTRFILALSTLAAIMVPLSSAVSADDATPAHAHTGPITAKQVEFQQAMRFLWEDHVTWTRLFIVDFAASSPETDATTQRLLENQVDIGDVIKPFYGEDAGNALTALLK